MCDSAMTNRELAYIVRDQKPLVLAASEEVRGACRAMWERRAGSVIVADAHGKLVGIFTGRDAVRLLAKGKSPADTRLAQAMTTNPFTVAPGCRAIEALRAMNEGGFRHVPVVEQGRVCGCVSRGDFKGMEFEAFRWRELGQTGSGSLRRTLGDVLGKRRAIMLATNATVEEACRAMWRRKAGAVLVVDARERLKGIFTGRDAVRALARNKDAAGVPLVKAMTADPASLPPGATAIEALRSMNDGGFRHIVVVEQGKPLGIVARADFSGVELDRLDEEEHLKECIW